MDYRISGERLKGFADQVRRISGVEGELTPEQMETNLLNVTPLGEYPKAEESAFGAVSNDIEYGILDKKTPYRTKNSTIVTSGWAFTPTEAFSIVGFRFYAPGNEPMGRIKLWDEKHEAMVAVSDGATAGADGWYYVYLDTAINVSVGTQYTVTKCNVYTSQYSYKFQNQINGPSYYPTLNAKLTGYSPLECAGDAYPTSFGYYPNMVDIVIAPLQAALPSDYQIQRTTMDDIAKEVQRISGATTKLSTAQIIAGLSEVEVLEDYEEVAF